MQATHERGIKRKGLKECVYNRSSLSSTGRILADVPVDVAQIESLYRCQTAGRHHAVAGAPMRTGSNRVAEVEAPRENGWLGRTEDAGDSESSPVACGKSQEQPAPLTTGVDAPVDLSPDKVCISASFLATRLCNRYVTEPRPSGSRYCSG